MPASTPKRKREPQRGEPRKRARSESVGSADGGLEERVLALEREILESKKHYNNIVVLLETARAEAETETEGEDGPELLATVALCRVFLRLLAAKALALGRPAGSKETAVATWLRERLNEYRALLAGLLWQSGDAALTALTLAMRLLQAEGQHLRAADEAYYFPQKFLAQLLRALLAARRSLGAEVGEALADEFVEKYASAFADVRFYTFRVTAALFRDDDDKPDTEATFYLLAQLDDAPDEREEIEDDDLFVQPRPPKRNHALLSIAQHKKQAQDAWVALLSSDGAADKALRKRALAAMETVIAPWFARPELLLDYLTDCYNAGGATSLLALSGLYYLIRERNVDYPAFYPKLYSLLDGSILHSKHRSRFLRLLDTFLASTHLPAQLVASFIKRLARLCLCAPPSAIVSIVPWIYNLLRRHPLCTFMLHRVPRSQDERDELARSGLADPFDAQAADPMETHAIDSCLWEVVQLQNHYHPNVATIAKILSEQFTKQSYNIEDFLDHSYQSMFDAEIAKEVKKTPVVEFQIPKHVFLPHDADAGVEDGLLVKLWNFV